MLSLHSDWGSGAIFIANNIYGEQRRFKCQNDCFCGGLKLVIRQLFQYLEEGCYVSVPTTVYCPSGNRI